MKDTESEEVYPVLEEDIGYIDDAEAVENEDIDAFTAAFNKGYKSSDIW